ncbi:hypothetical protein LLEC1_05474 [Akanthomyces lecanii]|uniref:Uncharacterized protein n=1 Tax=Cordyceps confragosa TaxID=2714763 RepID=A0A179IK25_CORDF|nr:hypothetical protein LLEC1_05474 [Akanthomyces lecanii]
MTEPRLPSLTIPSDFASPPYLAAPPNLSRSRSAHGLNAATGRPAMWTKDHQRALACLYVYTDLSLRKIIDVVFRRSPLSSRPIGTDSANKNLNHLLDKEPRWLHPKSREDMGSRLEQLAQSSSGMSSQSSNSSYDHHLSDLPQPSFLPVRFQSEGNISPSLLAVPHHTMGFWSAPASPMSLSQGSPEWPPSQSYYTPQPLPTPPPHPEEDEDRALFKAFLRRATIASSSTSTSTSSLRTALIDYSAAYRSAIKALLRRILGFSSSRRYGSPISDSSSAVMDWLDDEAVPTPYEGAPFPLPGDFLSIDDPARRSQLGHHQMLGLVSAAEELAQESVEYCPWVNDRRITDKGHRILSGHILESDWSDVDAFDNTLLHFVAVRGDANRLYNTISRPQARDILQNANTAGQTFFHVMDQGIMQNRSFVPWLVGFLRQESELVNVYAQDHYGRNFFHMLKANHVDPVVLNQILEPDFESTWNIRDAFGAHPRVSAPPVTYNPPPSSGMLLDSDSDVENGVITAQLNLVTFIRTVGNHNATEEDSEGRNGLHCLAAANLSLTSGSSTLQRSGSAPSPVAANRATTANGRRRSGSNNKPETDSSDGRMALRLELLKELLRSGVPANAYDAKGNTPLMAFAAQLPEDGNNKLGPEMIKLLVEHGRNVDARNRAGETALLIAVRCGRKLAARTLLELGANIYARDAMGRGVLEVSDAKMMAARRDCPREYAHLEACRAWLSGQKNGAMHNPTVLKEWGRPGYAAFR